MCISKQSFRPEYILHSKCTYVLPFALDKKIFQRHANVKLKCFLTESYLDNQKYNLLVSFKNIQRKKHFNH